MKAVRPAGKSGALRRLLPYVGLLVVLACEIGLRCVEWRPVASVPGAPQPTTVALAEDGMGDERFGVHWSGAGDFVPNQNGIWHVVFDRPFRLHSNSLGFRSREERRADAATIVVVGASTTFGPFLPEEDTWPAWMEHALRRTHDIQVFNGGRAGYTMRDKLNYIRDKVIDFKPDLVVISIDSAGGVDQRGSYAAVQATLEKQNSAAATTTGWGKVIASQRDGIMAAKKFLEAHSALVRTALELHKSFITAVTAYRKPSWEGPAADKAYRRDLGEAIDALRQAGISVMLVYVPLPYDLYPGSYPYVPLAKPGRPATYRIARSLADERGIALIDGAPAMLEAATPESGFLLQKNPATQAYEGDVHMSRYGNMVFGNTVAAGMSETGVIDNFKRYLRRSRPDAVAAASGANGRRSN